MKDSNVTPFPKEKNEKTRIAPWLAPYHLEK